ncbi:MAG: hypothetical protein EOO77_34060 [Oxalobacteraceae bacterium]|nr:MAG: hypothetical protein EOO77_34060 [Oxalobacteraceae bacterium]
MAVPLPDQWAKADEARRLRPELKVLFITGFAKNAAVGVRAVNRRRNGDPPHLITIPSICIKSLL